MNLTETLQELRAATRHGVRIMLQTESSDPDHLLRFHYWTASIQAGDDEQTRLNFPGATPEEAVEQVRHYLHDPSSYVDTIAPPAVFLAKEAPTQ